MGRKVRPKPRNSALHLTKLYISEYAIIYFEDDNPQCELKSFEIA